MEAARRSGMLSALAAMGTFTRGDRYQVTAVAIEEKRFQQWFKNAFYIFFSKQHCASLAAVAPGCRYRHAERGISRSSVSVTLKFVHILIFQGHIYNKQMYILFMMSISCLL